MEEMVKGRCEQGYKVPGGDQSLDFLNGNIPLALGYVGRPYYHGSVSQPRCCAWLHCMLALHRDSIFLMGENSSPPWNFASQPCYDNSCKFLFLSTINLLCACVQVRHSALHLSVERGLTFLVSSFSSSTALSFVFQIESKSNSWTEDNLIFMFSKTDKMATASKRASYFLPSSFFPYSKFWKFFTSIFI